MYSPIPEENCQVIIVIDNPLSGGHIVTRMDTSKYGETLKRFTKFNYDLTRNDA